MLSKILKKEKGITLVALIVTIVALIIVASIGINLAFSDNGIIKEAQNAKESAEIDEEQGILRRAITISLIKSKGANVEKDILEKALNDEIGEGKTEVSDAGEYFEVLFTEKNRYYEIDENGKIGEAKPFVNVAVGTKARKNGTINGEEGSANNPTIPAGYIPINTETSSWGDGSSAPTQESVDHGLVIKDESGNEWVWVPVEDVNTMCDTTNTTEYTLCGTSGDTAVKTKLYSKSGIISGNTRTTPGTTSLREPDLVVGSDGASYDASKAYYETILGFESREEMAKAFVADYEEMIKSVKTYGGFYIGRYELSAEGVQKNKEPLGATNWYNLYKKCKELNANEKVETRMIWGCQWDVTMNWLVDSGAKTSEEVFKDSSTWGNYKNTSVKADDGKTEIKASGTSTELNTGVTTFTMANNIYDLAGNCFEWTQEAYDASRRAGRGGDYGGGGSNYPASSRYNYQPSAGSSSNRRVSSHFNNKVGEGAFKDNCVKSEMILHSFLCREERRK